MTTDSKDGSSSTNDEDCLTCAGPFPVSETILTVHSMYDLPREMQCLDPLRDELHLVLRPVVRYYHKERRVASIPLPERVLPFSSASILYKNGRFELDLDALASRAPSAPLSRAAWVGGNQIPLPFPRPPRLTALMDVLMGVRQRRSGSSVVRWITGNMDAPAPGDGVGYFSIASAEWERRKCVTRVVGLRVGRVLCSLRVSPREAPDIVAARLSRDRRRLAAAFPAAAPAIQEMELEAENAENAENEEMTYRRLLRVADPEHHARRLAALLAMYAHAPLAPVWRRVAVPARADEAEAMLRRAVVELGPECGNVTARHRLLAFRKKFLLSEEDVLACLRRTQGEMHEALEADPEAVFAALVQRFGREPRPASYLFPATNFAPDRRALLHEVLHAAPRGEKGRGRRPPFTVSPCERPLFGSGGARGGKAPSEIEVLREKYAPEFAQIVPPIADAMRAVVEQNAGLELPQAESSLAVFQQPGLQPQITYQDFVHRTAEYTFISPSSLLAAVVYLDRLCLRHPNLLLTERNIFRLFLTAVRVASKVVELRSINNRHFANVFGIDMRTMNLMEEIFLKQMQFDLFLTSTEFSEYARRLQPSNAYQIPRAVSSQCGDVPSNPTNTDEDNSSSSNNNNNNNNNNTEAEGEGEEEEEEEEKEIHVGKENQTATGPAAGPPRERQSAPNAETTNINHHHTASAQVEERVEGRKVIAKGPSLAMGHSNTNSTATLHYISVSHSVTSLVQGGNGTEDETGDGFGITVGSHN